jgi:hypothetical protein
MVEILIDEEGNEYKPTTEKEREHPIIKVFIEKSIPMWFRMIIKDPDAMIHHLGERDERK